MTSYIFTDGGRSKEGFLEANDCTVRALSIISNTTYSKAHEFLKSKGRISKQAFAFKSLIGQTYNGKIIKALPRPRRTVGRYIRENPNGNYILRIARHVFAVKDGVIHDAVRLEKLVNCPVQRIFYLEL